MGMQSFLHAEISPLGFQRKEGIGDTPEIRLPIRQFTWDVSIFEVVTISKLPMRQFTTFPGPPVLSAISKLPMRQFTLAM